MRAETVPKSGFPTFSFGAGAVTAIGPALVIGALGYFFGWERTQALYSYLGIDPSLLGFSAQDFIFRSVTSLWGLVTVLVGSTIGLVLIHWLAMARFRFHPRLQIGGCFLIGAGILAAVPAIAGMYNVVVHNTDLLAPIALSLAAVTGGYGVYLFSLRSAGQVRRSMIPELPAVTYRALIGLIIALGASAVFWLTSDWAAMDGTEGGHRFEQGLQSQPEVIVFSRTNLGLESADANASTLAAGADGGYRYRYGGLRLVIESGGRLFLLPDSWRHGNGNSIVLADDNNIRIEIREHHS